jgi:serine protease Do
MSACRTSLWLGVLFLSLPLVSNGQDAGPASAEQKVIDVIARTEGAVVAIARVLPGDEPQDEEPGFGRRRWRDPPRSAFIPREFGSGVIVRREPDDGLRFVLTPRHVISGRSDRVASRPELVKYQVRLASRHTVPGTLYNQDERSDLAVLQLELNAVGLSPEKVPTMTLGQAEKLRKGSSIIGLGNPYAVARDGSASASLGMISNLSRKTSEGENGTNRPEESGTIFEFGSLLHVDLRLQLGASGTAILDMEGNLVGLGTSLAALQGYESTVGFAVPFTADVRRIVKSLLDGYEVEYGYLGVGPGDVDLSGQRDNDGNWLPVTAAQLERVLTDSPADVAGLQQGDCVLSVNDEPVTGSADLMLKVGMLGPETIARLTVWRPNRGSREQVDVPLGKWPVYDDSSVIAPNSRHPAWRGLSIDFSTARWRFMPPMRRHNPHIRAVVITKVEPGTAGAKAELQVGDFITEVAGQPVVTPSEFTKAVENATGPVELRLLDGRSVTLAP